MASTDQRSPRKDLMRDEVRRAAVEVFAQRGLEGATLQHVADALGTSRTALYRYFPNRDSLIIEVVRESARQSADIVATSRKPDRSVMEQLEDVVTGLVRFAITRPSEIQLLNSAGRDLPNEARAISSEYNRAFYAGLKLLIQEGVDAGVFRPVDAGVAAHVIAGAARTVTMWFDQDGPLDADATARQIATMMTSGLARGDASRTDGVRRSIDAINRELEHLAATLDLSS